MALWLNLYYFELEFSIGKVKHVRVGCNAIDFLLEFICTKCVSSNLKHIFIFIEICLSRVLF